MMTQQEFDTRLKEIEKEAGLLRDKADAYVDQELSRLFEACGWTQERVAKRMGKSQGWVQKRLCFGRFLKINSTGINPANLARLTERSFRRYWSKTKGKEEDRFRQVAALLGGCDLPVGYRNLVSKPGHTPAVRAALADGKWHKSDAIIADVQEAIPDFGQAQLAEAIRCLKRPCMGKVLESRHKGRAYQYRLVDAPVDPVLAATQALYEQIKPFLDDLLSMSRRHQGALAPGELAVMAVRMQRLFEAACAEDTADVQR